jgi:hypothetical protein
MRHKMQITGATVFALLACCLGLFAQTPTVNIDPNRHGNLWSAQQSIVLAYEKVEEAQKANHSHLGGHAAKAKDLLNEANQELTLAAEFADEH